MKTINRPFIHLRTGEPGAGATLHTIDEINLRYCNKNIFFSNISFINLPNWNKLPLSVNCVFNANLEKNTILFIDDFSKVITVENIDAFLKFSEEKELIIYLSDGDIYGLETGLLDKIELHLIDHVHYQVMNSDASLRLSFENATPEIIKEDNLEKLNKKQKDKKLIQSHCFFNKALIGQYEYF